MNYFKIFYIKTSIEFSVKNHLKEKYPQIADRILLMALESVNYAEDRAVQILQIVKDEEKQQTQTTSKQMHTATLECQHEESESVDNMAGSMAR